MQTRQKKISTHSYEMVMILNQRSYKKPELGHSEPLEVFNEPNTEVLWFIPWLQMSPGSNINYLTTHTSLLETVRTKDTLCNALPYKGGVWKAIDTYF